MPIIGVGLQSFRRILIGNLLLNKFHPQGLVSAIELISKFKDHQLFCFFHSPVHQHKTTDCGRAAALTDVFVLSECTRTHIDILLCNFQHVKYTPHKQEWNSPNDGEEGVEEWNEDARWTPLP